MSFICPIAAASMTPLQASAHFGLMFGVVVAGLIFLAAGAIAYRRERASPTRIAARSPLE